MKATVLIACFFCLLLFGCTSGPKTKSFFDSPTALQSPDGSVSGGRAYAFDNTMYACEIEPYFHGNIGVFQTSNNQKINTINALSSSSNDLKGLAWLSDNQHLAVMYHGGTNPGVNIYNINSGNLVDFIEDSDREFYHYILGSQDGKWIYLSVDGKHIFQYPIGILSQGIRKDNFKRNSGANLPWINYGWDIGRNPWGGNPGGFSFNALRLRSDLNFLSQSEINLVRVFIFCDLRSGILFDENGMPTSVDEYAIRDWQALEMAARLVNVKLIPVLFDFTLADGVSNENGNTVGEHVDLIIDSQKRIRLLEIIGSFLRNIRTSNEVVYAWEVMNEPENARVDQTALKGFITDIVQVIHAEIPSAKVTLGSRNRGDLPFWRDIGLDIYQFHYYDDMENQFPFDFPASNLGVDKPVLIGESQPTDITNKLSQSYMNGYDGMLFWSLNADYDFRSVGEEYKQWALKP